MQFSWLLQRLSKDPVGSRLSLQSTDGLETDSPNHASGRQNDRCVAKAQHMVYEGPGLARTLRHGGSCVCFSGWVVMPSVWKWLECRTVCKHRLKNEFLSYLPSTSWISAVCIHAYIYRQFNVILRVFFNKKVRQWGEKGSERVKIIYFWCCVRGESFSTLSNGAAWLPVWERSVFFKAPKVWK